MFGNTEDLIVSPQHSILITGWRAELFYGEDEVLVRAVDLLGHDGVYRRPGGVVNYWHILFDAHHVVKTAGIWSESLYPGEMRWMLLVQGHEMKSIKCSIISRHMGLKRLRAYASLRPQ